MVWIFSHFSGCGSCGMVSFHRSVTMSMHITMPTPIWLMVVVKNKQYILIQKSFQNIFGTSKPSWFKSNLEFFLNKRAIMIQNSFQTLFSLLHICKQPSWMLGHGAGCDVFEWNPDIEDCASFIIYASRCNMCNGIGTTWYCEHLHQRSEGYRQTINNKTTRNISAMHLWKIE